MMEARPRRAARSVSMSRARSEPRPMRLFVAVATVVVGVAPAPAAEPGTWQASGAQGAVVAGGEGAVEAGMTLLRDGGNAVDAAVATILALSVTDATSFCFGGEVPILIHDAQRGVVEV